MKIVFGDGREYSGTPVEIVKGLWDDNFHRDNIKSFEEYFTWFAQNVWKFTGKGITVTGNTLEERCVSLVSEACKQGIAKLIE